MGAQHWNLQGHPISAETPNAEETTEFTPHRIPNVIQKSEKTMVNSEGEKKKNNSLPGIWWKNPSLQQLFGLLQLQQQLGSLHPAPRRQPLARRLGRFALAAPAPHLAPVGVQQIHVVVRGNASGGGGSAFGTSKAVIF